MICGEAVSLLSTHKTRNGQNQKHKRLVAVRHSAGFRMRMRVLYRFPPGLFVSTQTALICSVSSSLLQLSLFGKLRSLWPGNTRSSQDILDIYPIITIVVDNTTMKQ